MGRGKGEKPKPSGGKDGGDSSQPAFEPKADPRVRVPRAFRLERTVRLLLKISEEIVKLVTEMRRNR
jgi:hypothetical protein